MRLPAPSPAEEIEMFNRIGDAWGETLGQISDAREEADRALAEAAVVEAAMAGKPTKVSPVAVEAEHAAKIAELEAMSEALKVAVDDAGNDMAVAIAKNRGAWLEVLAEVAAEAEGRYARAIKDAQAALNDLPPARGAVLWLQDFNHGHARIGTQTQFAGGSIRIEHRFPGTLQSEWDPRELLAAANEVVSPSPRPQLATSRASK